MKICDLTQFYSPVSGGVKRYVHEKVRHLHERTGDSHLLIVPGERDERTVDGRATVCTIRSPLLSGVTRYRALLRLDAVAEILERERPDLIESGDPYQVGWQAVASGRALGIPVIGFYHSHFPEAYLRGVARLFGATATEFAMDAARRYVRALYGGLERTLVPSPALAELLAGWGVGNVETVDLGVDTAVFRPQPDGKDGEGGEEERAATRAELGIPAAVSAPGGMLCLYVGRLAQEKNTRTLFEAFRRLHEEEPGRWHLLVVGDGLQRPLVEALREATGAVTWLPYCPEPQRLARIYRCADLFVHPGVQETFGLVALESQACGTPPVGIRGSYMDRIIYTGQRHWAAENSPGALAGAIRSMRDIPSPPGKSVLREAGERASRAVHAAYGWDRVFARLFGIYRDVIAAYKKGNVRCPPTV